MNVFKNEPVMVQEAKKAKFLPHGIIQVIIALGLIFISEIIGGVILGVIIVYKAITTGTDIDTSIENNSLILLYLTIITIIIVFLYVLLIERRSLFSMGFSKKHALKDYFMGYLVGIVMFSSVILLLVLTKNMSYESMTLGVLPIVLVFLIGFIFQGASEEILLRGYLMNSLAAKHNIIIAIIVNSSLFGILHILNPNVTFLSIVNIILFGLFASIYALKFGNLWGVMAIHSAWNFVQGNVFGLEVSGIDKMESLWHFTSNGKDYITGGEFGPEGGLAVTIVLLVSIIIVILLKLKRNEKME